MKFTLLTTLAVLATSVFAQGFYEYESLSARDINEEGGLIARAVVDPRSLTDYEAGLVKRTLVGLHKRLNCHRSLCKKDSTCVDKGCQYCDGRHCVE
jgi:hypothetical protein